MTLYLVGAGMRSRLHWRSRSALAALKPGGIADRLTVLFSLLGLSVPQFWLGLLLIIVFAVDLRWLPTSGSGTSGTWCCRDHAGMPA
jgi:peptide/nickel transport system permease protein